MPLLSVILNEVPLGTDTCHFEWSEAKSRNPGEVAFTLCAHMRSLDFNAIGT